MSDALGMVALYLFLSFFIAIPLMFILRVLYKYFIGMFQRKKKLQQAKEKGHVVDAWCIKRREPKGIPEPTDKYFATYSFEFNGKEYKRRFVFSSSPPTQMRLYFFKKPSMAEPENSFIGMEAGLFPFYICGVVLSFFFLNFSL